MSDQIVETQAPEEKPAGEVRVKPLSDNAFIAFFQKIARWWLGVWYGFQDKHPKLASLIYMVFFFIVFSEGVTIVQILILIFLPQVFGIGLAGTEFMIPKVWIPFDKMSQGGYYWSFLGNEIAYNKAGEVIIGGGLGYFLAFKIATFLAQCINFPLQRNITYRSHGNPYYQAMWYFIGWVLINLFCDAVNNLYLPLVNEFINPAIAAIIAMVAQGGIAMVIFFFIFLVIFPDRAKQAKSARVKLEWMKGVETPAEKLAKQQAKVDDLEEKAAYEKADKDAYAANSLANAKAVAWDVAVKRLEKAKAKGVSEEEINRQQELIDKKWAVAVETATKRDEANAVFESLKAARAAKAA